MNYKVRVAAKRVNVTPVITILVTEALYKRRKMLVLSQGRMGRSRHCYNQKLRSCLRSD